MHKHGQIINYTVSIVVHGEYIDGHGTLVRVEEVISTDKRLPAIRMANRLKDEANLYLNLEEKTIVRRSEEE